MERHRTTGTRAAITAVILLLLLSLAAMPGVGSQVTAAQLGSGTAKKVCHTVKKKVHGKLRKVRVCKSVAPKPTPTPKAARADLLARQLAQQVAQPSSASARRSSLLAVMKALHIGVYTDRGKALVRGAERTGNDFFLYDFEITALGNAFQRRQVVTLADLTDELNTIGSLPDNKPLESATLQRVLQAGVVDAQVHPTDRLSLLPLLVRELGLRHDQPYDLAQDIPADRFQFDALQQFLILADVVLPVIAREPPPSTRAIQGVQQRLLPSFLHPGMRPYAGPCDLSPSTAEAWNVGKWAPLLAAEKFAENFTKVVGAGVTKALAAISIVQAEMLAYSIQVTSTSPDNQPSHYGPAGHATDAGKEIRVTVMVRMLDDYGEDILSCGPLAGITLAPPGPVKGVGIDWTSQDLTGVGPGGTVTQSLKAHGTITVVPPDSLTGADGLSTFIFRPKDEAGPAIGDEKTANGTISGLARYQSAFGNLPGYFGQFLFPKRVERHWIVSYHRPRGYAVKLTQVWKIHSAMGSTAGNLVATDTLDLVARVCGDNLFAAPWKVQWDEYHHFESHGTDFSFHYDDAPIVWKWIPYADSTPERPHAYLADPTALKALLYSNLGGTTPNWADPPGTAADVKIELLPGSPPQVRLQIANAHGTSRWPTSLELRPTNPPVQLVPITEDTTCPERP